MIYIASCCKEGGIGQYTLDKSGKLHLEAFVPLDRPMYLAKTDTHLWVLLREPEGLEGCSGLIRFDIKEDGTLENPVDLGSTQGEVACHLCVEAETEEVWCVNYISGSVKKFPGKLIQHIGSSIHPRQRSAHTHFIGRIPHTEILCVTDLGEDSISLYSNDLQLIGRTRTFLGDGPRHLAFSPDGKTIFCVNELSSMITVFDFCKNHLVPVGRYSCLPEDFEDESTAAAIRISEDGKYLYASNRGHDSIACFKINGKELNCFGFVSSEGASPRDFSLFGDLLISTNELENCISVFRIKNGIPEFTGNQYQIASPVAVI